MIQHINAPVSVDLFFDHYQRKVIPRKVFWDGRTYHIIKVGLHHCFRRGRTLFHVFSVASREVFSRLVLDTDTLSWRVEEVADGETN